MSKKNITFDDLAEKLDAFAGRAEQQFKEVRTEFKNVHTELKEQRRDINDLFEFTNQSFQKIGQLFQEQSKQLSQVQGRQAEDSILLHRIDRRTHSQQEQLEDHELRLQRVER